MPGLHTPRKRPSRSRPKISSSHPRAELTLTHAPVTWLSAANKQVASAIKTQDRFVIKQALLMEGDLVDVINGAAVHQKMEFVGPAKSSANINHGVYKHKGSTYSEKMSGIRRHISTNQRA